MIPREASSKRAPSKLSYVAAPFIKLFSNHTKFSGFVLFTALLLIILANIWQVNFVLLSILGTLFIALTGMYLATLYYKDLILCEIKPESTEDLSDEITEIDLEFKETGITTLDEFFSAFRRRVLYLIDAISTIGEEAETLIERYEILTENLAASVVIRDAMGKITYCSPYTEVLTGYPLSEIYSSERDFFVRIANEEDSEKLEKALKVSSLGEAFQFRYRFFHKTGIEMWAETRTVPVLDNEGNVTSILSISLDVTGQVRYQKQVEDKNKDLQDFAYMISHDLKAPIFTIKGMVNILKEDCATLDDDSKETLTHIEGAAQRLSSLVASVLEYSEITSRANASEPVNLSDVIGDVLNDYSQQIKEIKAKVDTPQNLPIVLGDRTMIYQILSNLFGNALKYRDPERPLELKLNADLENSGRTAIISIEDSGMGIPADKIESIFRPFKRAHGGNIEGSGIGLACVKKLVDKLGGDISVESSVGQGSSFRVSLPAAR